jgi:type III restriction enzyme
MKRLRQWCNHATSATLAEGGPAYGFVYGDQAQFERHRPKTLAALMAAFREYQDE